MRQTTGSMLCPSCRKLISVSAEACPHCGAASPGMWGFGPFLTQFFGGRFDFVTLLPPICIGLYVLSLLLDVSAIFRGGGLFGLLSPSGAVLRDLGSASPYDLWAGRWWTVVTAIYLHGGLLHIFFNVMWIRSLGPEVERQLGSARFFVLWTLSGAFGFLLSSGLPFLGIGSGHQSIGASGSIFGLMAAMIVIGRKLGAEMMTRQLWTYAIVIGLMGFLFPGVDNAAHAGGFLGGWALASYYVSGTVKPEGRGTIFLALGLLAFTVIGFGLNFLGLILSVLAR